MTPIDRLSRWFHPLDAVWAATALGVGLIGQVPWFVVVPLTAGGLGIGMGLRGRPEVRGWAPVPLLVALGGLVLFATLSAGSELAAGLSALALLWWCGAQPGGLPGHVQRAAAGVGLPAAAFGVGWASSFLLPIGAGSVGIAAALLVGSAIAIFLLVRTPPLFDRDPAATS